jgi:FkbM family methyltransferase
LGKFLGLTGKIKNKNESVKSYSQFGEDIIVYDLFKDLSIQNISYLDIGANNPQYISNTYLFYEKGFRGVLIEPNSALCEKLKTVRPLDTVLNIGIGIDENIKEADFYLFPDEADGLSTFSLEEARHWEEVGMGGTKFKIERVVKMPLLNVNHVIANNFTECPDFISIDVEGWDLKILKTFDFEKYSPAVFCVETLAYKKDGSTYRLQDVNDFFESKGYFSYRETYANNIFVNKNLYDFYLYQKSNNKKETSA